MKSLWFGVQGLCFIVQGEEFKVEGLGYTSQGLRFQVWRAWQQWLGQGHTPYTMNSVNRESAAPLQTALTRARDPTWHAHAGA